MILYCIKMSAQTTVRTIFQTSNFRIRLATHFSHRELNPDTVTHPSTNRARRRVTSLIWPTSLPTTPNGSGRQVAAVICNHYLLAAYYDVDRSLTHQWQCSCPFTSHCTHTHVLCFKSQHVLLYRLHSALCKPTSGLNPPPGIRPQTWTKPALDVRKYEAEIIGCVYFFRISYHLLICI